MIRSLVAAAILAALAVPQACAKTPETPIDSSGNQAQTAECEPPYVRAELNFRGNNDDLVPVSGAVTVSVFQANGKPATVRDKVTDVEAPLKMVAPLHRETGIDICVEHGQAPLAAVMVFDIVVPQRNFYKNVAWVYAQFTNHRGRAVWSSNDYWPTDGGPIAVSSTIRIGVDIHGGELPQ